MNIDLVETSDPIAAALHNDHAIVEELLREIDLDVTEEEIQEIWDLCKNNPWNAPILYKIKLLTQIHKTFKANNI